jgi:hypothetical protein
LVVAEIGVAVVAARIPVVAAVLVAEVQFLTAGTNFFEARKPARVFRRLFS